LPGFRGQRPELDKFAGKFGGLAGGDQGRYPVARQGVIIPEIASFGPVLAVGKEAGEDSRVCQ